MISKNKNFDFDVIGFGAILVDRIVKVDKIKSNGHYYIKNEKCQPGGSAANTMIALKRLGFKTGFLGAVGNDLLGRMVLKDFKKEQVVSKLVNKKSHIGNCLTLVE